MEQNGSKNKSVTGTLKELADRERAKDRAEAEARRLGQAVTPVAPSLVAEVSSDAPAPQSLDEHATPDEPLWTSVEAAKFLVMSEKGFRNAVAAGKIPHYKLLGSNRFRRSELLALLVRVKPK